MSPVLVKERYGDSALCLSI